MIAKSKLQEETSEFFLKQNLNSNNVDYINDDYVERIQNALSTSELENAEKEVGKNYDQPQGLNRERSEWSGYIHAVSYLENTVYFSTPCPVPQDYEIDISQLISIKETGSCGNYTLYYAVINW